MSITPPSRKGLCSVRSKSNWLTRRLGKTMQKLGRRNTYTPTNIPHVCSNCDLLLNGEETPCVAGLKTFSNNSDAALTGFRLFQNGTCEFPLQKQPLSYRKNTYADTLILQLFMERSTLIPTLSGGVSATPAPHD